VFKLRCGNTDILHDTASSVEMAGQAVLQVSSSPANLKFPALATRVDSTAWYPGVKALPVSGCPAQRIGAGCVD